jgi:hypothetical protein
MGRRALGKVSFFGDGDLGEGMLKFLRIEPKLLIKLWTWSNRFSTYVQSKQRNPDLRRDQITVLKPEEIELVTYELPEYRTAQRTRRIGVKYTNCPVIRQQLKPAIAVSCGITGSRAK